PVVLAEKNMTPHSPFVKTWNTIYGVFLLGRSQDVDISHHVKAAGGRPSFDRLPSCTGRDVGRVFSFPQVARRTRLPFETASGVPRPFGLLHEEIAAIRLVDSEQLCGK